MKSTLTVADYYRLPFVVRRAFEDWGRQEHLFGAPCNRRVLAIRLGEGEVIVAVHVGWFHAHGRWPPGHHRWDCDVVTTTVVLPVSSLPPPEAFR